MGGVSGLIRDLLLLAGVIGVVAGVLVHKGWLYAKRQYEDVKEAFKD